MPEDGSTAARLPRQLSFPPGAVLPPLPVLPVHPEDGEISQVQGPRTLLGQIYFLPVAYFTPLGPF